MVPSPSMSELVKNKMMLLKQSALKTSANQTSLQAEQSGDKNATAASVYAVAEVPKKKTVRPAAWLLHTIGLRMVRERVYEDLIEVQEQKDGDSQLNSNEQKQLGRLRSAYNDIVTKNWPVAVRKERRCRCGFAARSRLEVELHLDQGSVSSGDDCRYSCCLCNFQSTRSPIILSAHIERTHGRQARMHALPPIGFCPFCPYEQRTVTKLKLSRHVVNCLLTFRIDRNLAPTASDADIPMFEIAQPPASSVQTTTAASDAALPKSSTSAPSALAAKTSAAVPALDGGCTTVSAAGPVMTPSESQPVQVTTSAAKTALTKLARLAPLPEGLGFEICELCGAFVATRQSLIVHVARAHKLVLPAQALRAEKPLVSCDRCSERFWTALGLENHAAQMHGGGNSGPVGPPVTVCPLCKRTRLTDVVEHLARQHRITLVDMFAQRYCSVCQLTLHSARSFELHMLTRHADLFPDRAGLYAAIVLVDRATRGRVGMVARGRQPAVLSGATCKPSSDPISAGSQCPVCKLEFADAEKVEEHVQRAHPFVCTHCGRRCTSSAFLRQHVETVHSADLVSCQLCDAEVTVAAMAEHLTKNHMRSCSVTLTPLRDSVLGQVTSLERKRRRGSKSSDSRDSSDDDECSEPADIPHSAAKKLKLL